MFPGHFDPDRGFYGILAEFAEVCPLGPPFRRGTVRHGQYAVSPSQTPVDNVYPWGDDCCQVFEEVI